MDSAWDRLLDLVDHVSASTDAAGSPDLERRFTDLCTEGVADGSVDRELHVPDVSRWLVGLVHAHRAVRDQHPGVDADDDLAVLRVIITRWLHPARPR